MNEFIIQIIGIIGLVGLSGYSFFLSHRKYADTFIVSGRQAIRALSLLAGVLAFTRLLVLVEVMDIHTYFVISGVVLLVLLGWLLATASKDA